MNAFRIVFLGTGDIALPVLDSLLHHTTYELVGVVTQPDRPVGRKQELTPPEVKVRAEAAGVPVLQPERVRRKAALAEIAAWEADVVVVMAYGQILPNVLLDMPKVACLNLHASLLPRHRGAAPVQAAIRDGDARSGMTVMYVAEGLDAGDILLQHDFELAPDETGQSLHDRLAECSPAALEEALELLANGQAPRIPQDEALATHTGKLTREHGRLDWAQSAVVLERQVRAFMPWPGSLCGVRLAKSGVKQLKVFPPVRVVPLSKPAVPGTIVQRCEDMLVVATVDGGLGLTQVQLEGKKRVSVKDFVLGHPLNVGDQLSSLG